MGHSVLAIIPARGGSKRIPGKNLKTVGGQPLIAWTIRAALAAKCVDRVILSTDDSAIMAIAQSFGCDVPFIRPKHLSTDQASSVDVVLHALSTLDQGFDIGVLLQPTSPLRTAEDIDGCVKQLIKANANTCVAVSPVAHRPEWHGFIANDGCFDPFRVSRSVSKAASDEDVYMLNGAGFVFRTQSFIKNEVFVDGATQTYIMPEERSLDIDTSFQLHIADVILTPDIHRDPSPK